MKSFRKVLNMHASAERIYVNITGLVERSVRESTVVDGLCLVNSMNIAASVFINDDEVGLHHDFEEWLNYLAPTDPPIPYRHIDSVDEAQTHLKRTVMGREVVCAITNGRLDFGTGEQIFYAEFGDKQDKKILIKIIGE